jgi:hypothetical protein
MQRMNRAPSLEAPLALLPLPRPLMAGEVLDAAYRLFRAGLLRTLPYSGLAVLVLELPTLYETLFGASSVLVPVFRRLGLNDGTVVFVCALLLTALLIGVITLRLDAISRGARPRFRREIASALRRWPAALIATLGAFGVPLALYVVSLVINPYVAIAVVIVLMVPMLWPMALFIAALPAFWCDGLGPFAAIAQSVRISRRRTWRMIGAILATVGLVAVFYILAAILAAVFGALFASADLFLMAMVRSLLSLVVGAFGVPFVIAMLVVAYEDLKLRDVERRGAHP